MPVDNTVSLDRYLRLWPGTVVDRDATRIEGPVAAAMLDTPASVTQTVLNCLSEWTTPAEVFAAAIGAKGTQAGPTAAGILDRLKSVGALEHAVFENDRLLARIHVIAGTGLGSDHVQGAPPLIWVQALSLRPEAGGWHLSSALAQGEAWLAHAALPDIGETGWIPDSMLEKAVAALLTEAGLLMSPGATNHALALSDAALAVHAQSRRGSARTSVGATGVEPVPETDAVGAVILPQPGALPVAPLQTVLAQRRSQRVAGAADVEIDAETLSKLLWMAVRDRGKSASTARKSRPYPGAGGWHRMAFYVALCGPSSGLPAFSRYDAAHHRLVAIDASPDALLRGAGQAMGAAAPPGLIILATEFAALANRYGDAAYPLILKEAGAAMQTLHLCATALGIGSCILGGGNSRDFAIATGRAPLGYGPVGEMALTGPLCETEQGDT
ncbi:MAG: SagB family peptide dehydrogenase [Sulfitobacter sp.]